MSVKLSGRGNSDTKGNPFILERSMSTARSAAVLSERSRSLSILAGNIPLRQVCLSLVWPNSLRAILPSSKLPHSFR